MSNPYDLSSGYKGFKALAAYEHIRMARYGARHLRSMTALEDPLDPEIRIMNNQASELERKAFELEKQMKPQD